MSVRRLADDSVQPPSFAFNKENAAWAKATIKKYPKGREQSAIIPLMMRAQDQDGWVTRAAIESIADMLGMPYIRALEVATFYTQFQLKPVGTRAHIQVCGTTPCMLRGAEDLKRVCREKIHPEQFHTNEGGRRGDQKQDDESGGSHQRSTSPNTMSSEPRTADTSASWWPLHRKSIDWRCA